MRAIITYISSIFGGLKTLFKGMSDWADVINAIDYWALQAKYRVCLLKKRTNCEKPPMFG